MPEIVNLYPNKPPRKPRVFKKAPKRPPNALRKRSWGEKVHRSREQKLIRKKGKKSLSKYKKELDAIFSKYIRAKYGPNCYTCIHEKGNQNGHFVLRQYLATRWEEDNCRPQGFGCNIRGKGKVLDFEEKLIKELGPTRVQELKDSRKILMKLDEDFYLRNIAHYTRLLEELETKP